MNRIAIATDSSSGLSQKEAEEMGVYMLPLPFLMDGREYFDGASLTHEEFYEGLAGGAEVSTSQPAPGDVMSFWDCILEEYDEIVYIPLSSGLSNGCQTAAMLSQEDKYAGRVEVVNNQRVSVTLVSAVRDAVALAAAGKAAAEIRRILEEEALQSSIYITVATLKYLKKGGRITPAAAALGTILKIKPVLQIQGEKLDAFAKVRTMGAAKRTMIEAIHSDIEQRFPGRRIRLGVAYTKNLDAALELKKELEAEFPQAEEIILGELSPMISCHIGEGSLAAACSCMVEV